MFYRTMISWCSLSIAFMYPSSPKESDTFPTRDASPDLAGSLRTAAVQPPSCGRPPQDVDYE